ncbi:TetR/AcrR family transcriptional regulator [Rhodococcus opacus]|uniref:TetR/AcrR family transcriptional regulator n=1 Tax=Rhodococcus opacus TaxID=37919 RepID=UPI002474967C|nr:TetR/AcrR family transcriptional regulator [Rhodococcus opacus]MDH6291338.1 AcrR family transcriptional regulator [Rhodococcus opacus]
MAETRAVGRPRNPEIDKTVLEAAAQVYTEAGWAGFHFDAIARRAGVGKAALYRRWDSAEDLLIGAIHTVDAHALLSEASTIEEALTLMVQNSLNWWSGGLGHAYIRLQIDQVEYPFLRDLYRERVTVPLVAAMTDVVQRGIQSGELPPGTSATLLMECLSGATMNRMAASAKPLRNRDKYVKELVAFLLGGMNGSGRR